MRTNGSDPEEARESAPREITRSGAGVLRGTAGDGPVPWLMSYIAARGTQALEI